MTAWMKPSAYPIGIDIGTYSVKLLQLEKRGGGMAIHAANETPMDPADAADPGQGLVPAVAAIRPLLASGQFVGKRCVVALPPQHVQCRTLRLPRMPAAEVDQAIYWEAKDRFGFDLDAGRMAYFASGEVRKGAEVRDEYLIFAAAPDLLARYVELLCGIGLEPVAIDLQPAALARAAQQAGGEAADSMLAILDIGAAGSQVVLASQDSMIFYKYIPIGGRHFSDAVAGHLRMSVPEAVALRNRLDVAGEKQPDDNLSSLQQAVFDALRPTVEDLAREIELCLRYYAVTFRGAKVTQVCLTGGESYCHPVAQALSAVLSMPVLRSEHLEAMCPDAAAVFPRGSAPWALAAGLSLHGRQKKVKLLEAAA